MPFQKGQYTDINNAKRIDRYNKDFHLLCRNIYLISTLWSMLRNGHSLDFKTTFVCQTIGSQQRIVFRLIYYPFTLLLHVFFFPANVKIYIIFIHLLFIGLEKLLRWNPQFHECSRPILPGWNLVSMRRIANNKKELICS